jgi:hypothetical protein
MKFKRINGWSYKTEDGKFMISNCGPRSWFSAEIDQEASNHHGWEIPLESSKVYHATCREAQDWVVGYEMTKAGA